MSILAIWGPPQSGKTTLAIDLSRELAAQNKSVCLISPEPYSEMSVRLDVKIEGKNSLNAALENIGAVKQIVKKVDDLLFVLAVSYDHDAYDIEISESAVRLLLEHTATVFDFVLVDCPTDTSNVFGAWALNMADTVLMTMGTQNAAVIWGTANTQALEAMARKTLHISVELIDSFDYAALHDVLHRAPFIRLPYQGHRSKKLRQRNMNTLCARLMGGCT